MTRLARLLLPLALVLFAPACACGEGGGGGPDGGSSRRRDTGIRRLPDGRVLAEEGAIPGDRSTDPCGALGQRCCRSNSCDLGLRCDEEAEECRSRPGGAACETSTDCSTGFVCEDMNCAAPDGSACIGSSDCREERICQGGVCVEPSDACGATDGECCTGDVCRAGNVCEDSACEECGDDGELCCDGSGSCASTALLCIDGSCEEPEDCGTAAMPCCSGDACVRGSTCTSGMCVRNPAPGSAGSSCGGDGDDCCPGQVCGFGTICEAFLTNTCLGLGVVRDLVGFDCGGDGELCCFLDTSDGLDFFTCEGDLQCSWLFCSGECTAPSETCTVGSACCDEAQCRLTGASLRCCLPREERCTTHLDCCGSMLCMGNVCRCRTDGQSCSESQDCCEGSECLIGICQSTTDCTEPQEPCAGASECCAGLQCREVLDHSDGPEDRCCASGGTACTADWDCCGALVCDADECTCNERGGECVEDDECCGDDICVLRQCTADTGCQRIGETCDSGNLCCSPAACQHVMSPTSPTRCCARAGRYCEGNSECCGMMTCEDNACQERETGESCLVPSECATGDCLGATPETAGTCGPA